MSIRSRCLSVAVALGLGIVLGLMLLSALGAERAALAQAGTGVIRVATTGSDAPGCGGAANPCRTIQYAVDAAQAGEEIRVATGVYTGVQSIPSLNTDILTATQLVAINKSLVIRGGYPAGNWSTPDPAAYLTTLDAQALGRVVLISGTITVKLEGLRITGGNAAGLGGDLYGTAGGGGVWARGATVTIADCEIRANGAYSSTTATEDGYGGGVYLWDCPGSVLKGNTLSDNRAAYWGHGQGGAVCLRYSTGAQLLGNMIQGNIGTRGSNGYGGAAYVYGSERAVIEGNTFQDNVGSLGANYYGGGLYLRGAHGTLVARNTFRGNVGGSSWSFGGGLFLDWNRGMVIKGNTFEDNVASTFTGWGGGMCVDSMWESTVDGNLFRGNKGTSSASGSSWGGGASLKAGEVCTLTNNAFIENEVTTSGSGLYVENATPLLLHNTFAANHGGDGSALSITGTLGAVIATNTIVAGHAQGILVAAGGSAVLDHTLWYGNAVDHSGNVAHTADLYGDPAFATDGYHVTRQSAALNSGVDAGVNVDIDGQARPSLGGYEIGADELGRVLYLPLVLRSWRAGP